MVFRTLYWTFVVGFLTLMNHAWANASYLLPEEDALAQGRSFFHLPWVAAPSSTTARDGLGPLFNTNACVSCHETKLKKPRFTQEERQKIDFNPNWKHLIVKLSQASQHAKRDSTQITVPDPVYGYQLSPNNITSVAAEATPLFHAKTKDFIFNDGTVLPLRYWELELQNLGYGPLAKETGTSIRLAPFTIGLSLIEAIPNTHLLQTQQKQQEQTPWLAGKVNWVYDAISKEKTVGKFGWKASQANLVMQSADAALNDMGLTSLYFPHESCTPAQTACLNAPQGRILAGEEPFNLSTQRLYSIAFYTGQLPLPPQPLSSAKREASLRQQGLSQEAQQKVIASIERGQEIFAKSQCIHCHQSQQTTETGKVFYPYSDFLLHDMGEELADQRPEFDASASEWRTAPLWRNSYKTFYLHDGRARTLAEAIAWHGGQATQAREAFRQLSEQERQDLFKFLESL
ncbi:di-heme oxidoredictase family protein [Pelistega ratti]|uniref:di-heme oxidoredictase family protein n=1 Tax=Pelistega ratti TaxID=2652177 RepID=UPI001FAB1563|nr:di-heme oxidoredictase family protein [Pelistega ratti]